MASDAYITNIIEANSLSKVDFVSPPLKLKSFEPFALFSYNNDLRMVGESTTSKIMANQNISNNEI